MREAKSTLVMTALLSACQWLSTVVRRGKLTYCRLGFWLRLNERLIVVRKGRAKDVMALFFLHVKSAVRAIT